MSRNCHVEFRQFREDFSRLMSYVCEFAAVHDLASTMLVVFFCIEICCETLLQIHLSSVSPFPSVALAQGVSAQDLLLGHSSRYALSQSH